MLHYMAPCVAALILALVPLAAFAQAATTHATVPSAGTRVRLLLTQPVSEMVGRVMSSDGDTIVVKTDGDGNTIAVPMVRVTRVDVSGGTRTHRLRGTGVGFLGGATIGALAGLASYRAPKCGSGVFCLDSGPEAAAMGGAATGGVLGAVVGLLVGSTSTELWDPIAGTPHGGARVGIAPSSRGGVALTASLTF